MVKPSAKKKVSRKRTTPRQKISPDISNERIVQLLKVLKPSKESKSPHKSVYEEYASKMKRSKSPIDYQSRLLVDTLAGKMCRCEGSADAKKNTPPRPIIGACRKSVFQHRGLDFYTYNCKPKPKLNPKVGTLDPVVLRTFG